MTVVAAVFLCLTSDESLSRMSRWLMRSCDALAGQKALVLGSNSMRPKVSFHALASCTLQLSQKMKEESCSRSLPQSVAMHEADVGVERGTLEHVWPSGIMLNGFFR